MRSTGGVKEREKRRKRGRILYVGFIDFSVKLRGGKMSFRARS
jgi:hypothetical protein